MASRQQRTPGAILKIDLGDGYHSYARILGKANYAFYDLKTKVDIKDMSEIVSKPILFIVSVYDDVITRGRWLKVGKLPLEESLQSLPFKFIQDLYTGELEQYNSNTGEIKPATKAECEGLERAAVWEADHVESRLRDFYSKKPNLWVEQLKMK